MPYFKLSLSFLTLFISTLLLLIISFPLLCAIAMGALAQDSPIWAPTISPRSTFTASAFNAALLQFSALNLKDYEWTEQERPLIAHNQFENDRLIPVIDMAVFASGRSTAAGGSPMSTPEKRKAQRIVAANMAMASQEWGFFQVINHGIAEELIKDMERHARGFFEELSLEEKKMVLRDSKASKPMGYACGGAGTRLKRDLPWIESLQLPCVYEEMEAYARKIWQDGNKDFRRVVTEFSTAMRRVTMVIMEVLVGQLKGGCVGALAAAAVEAMVHDGARNSVVRYNYYPPCPQPSLTLGLGAHSDPHLLTLLHQDMVGGLQICKDGLWIAVKPRPNALVVNIGDALQVWSNDVYKSVEHRAVCNSGRSRLSMGFFLNPIDEAIISPSTTSCPHYNSFSWKEYRECMYTHRPKGKSNLLRFRIYRDQENSRFKMI